MPSAVFWQEHSIAPAAMEETLTDEIITEILWDLFEHNFCFELLALDRALVPDQWASMKFLDRDALLRTVFFDCDEQPGGAYVVERLPLYNCGLAADDWLARRLFVDNLRVIMLLWPNATHSLPCGPLEYDENEFLRQEQSIAAFYCQSFFNVFGRAAIVPHGLRSTL